MSLTTLSNLVRIWRQHPVTRTRQLAAARRFVGWQIASRLHRGKLVVPFVNDTRLVIARGQTGLTGNVYFGLAEMNEMAFVLHTLRPGELFVDVGANLGSFSVLASGAIGARSIAFEPVPATVAEMREQLRLNDIADKVEVRTLALGDKPGTVRFFETRDTVNRVVVDGEADEGIREVPQSTLDVELDGLDPVLIKMDVEGYEYAVLRGAAAVLGKPSLNAIIMEVHDGVGTYGVDRDALRAIVESRGFKPFVYDPVRRALDAVDFSSSHGLSDNVLMIRDIDAARGRVVSAPKFTVQGVSF